jgi:hypothetical protein
MSISNSNPTPQGSPFLFLFLAYFYDKLTHAVLICSISWDVSNFPTTWATFLAPAYYPTHAS